MTGQVLAQINGAVAKPAVVPAAPAADPDVAKALTDLRADGGYQFDFPEPDPPPETPEWMRGLGQGLADFFNWLGGDGNLVVRGLAYLLIAVALLFVLYLTVPAVREWVDRFVRSWRGPGGEEEDDQPGWQPDANASRNLLAEADALADAGRFGEAAHLLLGRSIEDIASRRPGLLKPALTARAIATVDDLPGAARTAFARIAEAVERSLWARRAIGQPDWQDARTAYEAFAFGPHWREARR
jgi:hypothetical protein